jgi:hypothetical protein
METTETPLPGTRVSESEFDLERAKEFAQTGPVFLTHGDYKTHVFLSIESYKKISKEGLSLFDVLCDPAAAETDDLELPSRDWGEFKIPEFD